MSTDTSFLDRILDEPPPAETPRDTRLGLAFSTKRFALRALVDRASRVVPTRDSMPILKCLRIESTGGRLQVTATDLELTLITSTDLVQAHNPGVAYLPAKRLADILSGAADDTISIDVVGRTARINCGAAEWQLNLLGGDDWPPTPEPGNVDRHDVDRAAFLAALKRVRYAAARDTRAALRLIDIRSGRMTACDGARLQQVAVAVPLDCQLPVGAVDDLVRLLADSDQDTFTLAATDNSLVFNIGADVLIVRQLSTRPVDMEGQLLQPALANDLHLSVPYAELVSAIQRVRINADPKTPAITITIYPQESDAAGLIIAARDADGNSAGETLAGDWTGPERVIAVHSGYLIEAATALQQPQLSIYLRPDTKTQPSPLLLKDDQGAFGVLPQMRVD